eukprot:3723808-Pleurochrysis_carterae.AAC.3
MERWDGVRARPARARTRRVEVSRDEPVEDALVVGPRRGELQRAKRPFLSKVDGERRAAEPEDARVEDGAVRVVWRVAAHVRRGRPRLLVGVGGDVDAVG